MKILDVPQSGSIGGVTSSHNRAGQYRRARRTPVSPTRTPKQGVARARFGTSSALWQSLTPTLQAAWTAFAHAYPVVDSLGQSVVMTGQQYFVGINSQLLACGQQTSNAVPSNTTLFPIDTPVVYADDEGVVMATIASLNPGDFNKVSLSSVKSNGVSFNSQFSLFGVFDGTGLTLDLTDAYTAQYGVPGRGRAVFANFVDVNSSGMSGNDTILRATVVTGSVIAAPVVTNVLAGTVVSTGPGAGTEPVGLFMLDTEENVSVLFGTVNQVAGVATFPAVQADSQVYTRTLVAGVWGMKSNVIAATI